MDRHLTKRELTEDSEKQTLKISFNEAASLRRKYFYFFKVLAVLIHVRNPTDVVPRLSPHANPPCLQCDVKVVEFLSYKDSY